MSNKNALHGVKRSHLVHFTQNSSNKQTQSTHRKARLELAIRDARKLAQNVFPPRRTGHASAGKLPAELQEVLIRSRGSPASSTICN